MKAIINISNKHSQYSKFNGLTFEVGELMKESVGLLGLDTNYPFNQTDFHFSEIIIVDIKKEFKEHPELKSYIQIKKIQL